MFPCDRANFRDYFASCEKKWVKSVYWETNVSTVTIWEFKKINHSVWDSNFKDLVTRLTLIILYQFFLDGCVERRVTNEAHFFRGQGNSQEDDYRN